MAFISVTRLRLRHWRFFPEFAYRSARSVMQIKKARGHLASTTLKEAGLVFWTCSAWADEASMKAFMISGAHKLAMVKLLGWCDEAALAHWTQESAALPTWAEAHRRLLAQGRRSKVHHPSPRQVAFEIPAPRGRE